MKLSSRSEYGIRALLELAQRRGQGPIQSREIVHSSGDTMMDQSVMTAAERVQQIDPLPAGLGSGDSFEVNIAFKLDQGQ